MQLEVILPLVAYLVVVFGISVYAMRKRSTGTFLNEYFRLLTKLPDTKGSAPAPSAPLYGPEQNECPFFVPDG